MRITRDQLIRLARENVQFRLQRDRRLVCIYLTGSLLLDEPLLGGTADIDLVFVHDSEPYANREIARLSDEVHLDIAHFSQTVFHQPRHLRVSPWIGPYLCYNPVVLHDSQHWFEFTQASVCAQFNDPENVYQRVGHFAATARQTWMDLRFNNLTGETRRALAYVEALEDAANAVASFSGPPLTERRMLLHYPQRARAINRPGLAAGLVDMIMPETVSEDDWKSWQAGWNAALTAAGKLENAPARLHPARKAYYTRGAGALWGTDPASAVWLMLRTWTLAVHALDAAPELLEPWRAALRALRLDADSFESRLDLMDAYLDNVEESMEEFAQKNGIDSNG